MSYGYYVSPDGANGFMEWHIMRRDDPPESPSRTATAIGVSFDEETGGEEMAEKVAKALNEETDLIRQAWRRDANLELSMEDLGPFPEEEEDPA